MITSRAEWVEFQSGEVVIEVDSEISHVYFLLTGRVEATLYDALGKEIEKDTIARGFAVGLLGLGSPDQAQLRASAIEPSIAIRFTVADLLQLAGRHPDFQRAIFHLVVNAFKRYVMVDRSLPKPSIVGIVHHTEVSRPIVGRLARRLRELDESPCIAGDEERWRPDEDIPFKLIFEEGRVGKNVLKDWALDRRLLIDVRADQPSEAMLLLLTHADTVLWCVRPQDAGGSGRSAVPVSNGFAKAIVPRWRDKIRIAFGFSRTTHLIAPYYVPELL